MIAQHDAILLAWKEKRRFDFVRPVTMIWRLFGNEKVMAWRGVDAGVGEIVASQWEPAVRTMPHSEYPSASAVLCTASLGVWQYAFQRMYGSNFTEPVVTSFATAGILTNYDIRKTLRISYRSLKEAVRVCGQSRVWAGLHFQPAVEQGHKIGAGVGGKAYDYVESLNKGILPSHCQWCTKSK